MRIESVRSWTVKVPLERPLNLGGMTIPDREYIFVRIEDESGRQGSAWSLTRGLPVGPMVEMIAGAHVVGRDVEDTARIWHGAHGSNGPAARIGVPMRALSLIDIALWDLKAQLASLPLHRLLGGLRDRLPVIAVSGYPGTGRNPEEMAERLTELARQGHDLVKAARWPDPADTARLLARTEVPGLIVDAAWAWEDAESACRELAIWGDTPLVWLEDPFPAHRANAYRRLRERGGPPVGTGDESADPDLLANLAMEGRTDVLRMDATVAGGVTGALRLLDVCWHAGIPASFHIGLPIHLHLAAAAPASLGVEAFIGEDIDLDPIERLLVELPPIESGKVTVPEADGIGCRPDWERITATAHSQTTVTYGP